MGEHLPKAFLRTEDEDIREKAEDTRGLSNEQRWHIMDGLCQLAAASIAQHPDPQRALDFFDPIPDESLLLLKRLRERYERAP